MIKEFGKHFLVEMSGCNPEKIRFVEDVEPIFIEAAQKSKATLLEHAFHQFEPDGVSGMIFIAESHFSIHTWPEDRYVAVDVLTCGEMEPQTAIDLMRDAFEAKTVDVQIISRGFTPKTI